MNWHVYICLYVWAYGGYIIKLRITRHSQVVQWLGLYASTAGDTGLFPGREMKISRAAWLAKKTKTIAYPFMILRVTKFSYIMIVCILYLIAKVFIGFKFF